MNEETIKIERVSKSFAGVKTIDNISLILRKGEIAIIIGGNGAGKTTLFNLITGIEKPDSGKLFLNNYNITNNDPLKIAQMGIVRLYQSPKIFKNMSVIDNMIIAFKLGDVLDRKTRAISLLTETDILVHHANDKAGTLSFGKQKLLAFCMVLINDNLVLLLDEPFAGINSEIRKWMKDKILEIKAKKCVMIIEHNLNDVEELADVYYKMEKGQIELARRLNK